MAMVIDGKSIAKDIRETIKGEVTLLRESTGRVPGLATVLVGDDPASAVYVRMKRKACAAAQIHSAHHQLASTTTQEDLVALVGDLNRDERIHGILVQLPLPAEIDESTVLESIDPRKDVDGFHPMNMGRLLSGIPAVCPCTPTGIIRLIESTGTKIEGKSAVVIGRSNIVGKPVAIMLLKRHATVTICHTRTADLPARVGDADILIAAAGSPGMVKGRWIKEGAVVIDVGVNRTEDGRLVGDVEFEVARQKAAAITPVPGGVGPMTIAMLLSNTLLLAKQGSAKKVNAKKVRDR